MDMGGGGLPWILAGYSFIYRGPASYRRAGSPFLGELASPASKPCLHSSQQALFSVLPLTPSLVEADP